MTLDELADFLNSDNVPEGSMDLSELDGFLAGLIAGPEPVPADEWMPEIFGDEEPDYESDEQQQAVEQAIQDRYRSIQEGLDSAALTYSPILWVDEAGSVVAEDWAAAFMHAVSLRSEAWQPALADEDASALLIPIASLAGMTLTEEERAESGLTDDALDGLMKDAGKVLPVCVLGLRRFWREQRESAGMIRH